jgi:hypothetical protein
MKGLLFGFVFLISVIVVSGQCAIDYTYYPVVANYGLSPDSLPDGYVGQFYDEDMTFYLPLDTTDASSGAFVTFEDFHITSISLPLGLTWECNNSLNSCHYDPAVTQYGCVKVSGHALVPGYYDVEVNLVATHDYSWAIGSENISFILPLTILPDTSTSSNAGFAMTPPSGCLPMTVDFTNNNTGMLSYFWDFGNGNTSNLEHPGPQIYNDTGMYIVQYAAVQTDPTYFLESIEVVGGTCTDNILIGDVDLFYTISTSAGVVQAINVNNAITQSFPLTINLSSPLQLTGQDVTIEVWDDDGWAWGIEDCGSFSFTPMQQAGAFAANGGGLSINYSVIEVPGNIVASIDTIYVYDYPPAPDLVYDTLNNLIYTTGNTFAMQWYYYNSPIPGATDTFVEPESSGLYSLVVVNEYGCTAVSFDVLVVICDTTYQPILDNNGSTAWMLDSALYANLQWYDNNGIINGANQPFFPANGVGMYYIVATDTFGCSYSSESVFLGHTNLESIPFSGIVRVGPNPISNGFPLTIYIENAEFSDVTIILMDLYGREVIHRVVNSSLFPYRVNSQEISRLSNGLYYLDISFDGNKIRQKIIKAGAN